MIETGYMRVDYDFLPEDQAKYYEPISEQTLYLSKLRLHEVFEHINEKFYKEFFISYNDLLVELGGKPSNKLRKYGWSFENESQDYCWSYFSPAWIRPQYYVNKASGELMIIFEVEPEPIEELKHERRSL